MPIIEEAFFRGYVLARLANDSVLWKIAGIAVSSALFALLHGRWVAAGLAGVVFGLIYLRRRCLVDAVVAHAAANSVIAAAALWYGDWSLI
ncbi:type II CAAX prenyl endopeptidase Rce1 family protein [Roseovarius sp. S4756]|uniref:CPBP family glutamic-type intramembrane protease n=1 Tax=Roseovarius maritimus TaxID=3342637 RepID=UPI00372C171C